MIVVYTDDCIYFSKQPTTVDWLIADPKLDSFLLKDKGDTQDFLGVDITKDTKKK